MKRALIDTTLAEKRNNDVAAAVQLARQSCASRHWEAAGDDAIPAKQTELHVRELLRHSLLEAPNGQHGPVELAHSLDSHAHNYSLATSLVGGDIEIIHRRSFALDCPAPVDM